MRQISFLVGVVALVSMSLNSSEHISKSNITNNMDKVEYVEVHTPSGIKYMVSANEFFDFQDNINNVFGQEKFGKDYSLVKTAGETHTPATKEELETLINDNVNLGDINTSKITDLSYLFLNSSREDFSGIEKWDVSNVTNMNGMFAGAENFNHNIGSWNVSKVTDMGNMFAGAIKFNQDIGKWNVSNVTNMNVMFNGAEAFNQDISGWNVSKVQNMEAMFWKASKFNQNLGNWNVSNVVFMNFMFEQASSFNQDLSKWNVSKVKKMEKMFTGSAMEGKTPAWYKK